jgi:outer membrane protein assembly factor BamA
MEALLPTIAIQLGTGALGEELGWRVFLLPLLQRKASPVTSYRVGEIKFTGATLLSADELISALHVKSNALFNTESVRRGLENIQKSYAKKGHPNVTAIPIASVDEKNRNISLEIKLQDSAASQ